MGIDYGTKRVGLAFADADTCIATPYETINNDESITAEIKNLCKEKDVETIVIGESKQLSGADNPVMKKIRTFKKALEEKTGLPVIYIPEFFTSAQARRQPEAKKNVDGSAAAIILQSYLDTNSYEHED